MHPENIENESTKFGVSVLFMEQNYRSLFVHHYNDFERVTWHAIYKYTNVTAS